MQVYLTHNCIEESDTIVLQTQIIPVTLAASSSSQSLSEPCMSSHLLYHLSICCCTSLKQDLSPKVEHTLTSNSVFANSPGHSWVHPLYRHQNFYQHLDTESGIMAISANGSVPAELSVDWPTCIFRRALRWSACWYSSSFTFSHRSFWKCSAVRVFVLVLCKPKIILSSWLT